MSRHLIAYEGRVSKDKRLVQPGALEWDPDKKLPVIGYSLSDQAHYQMGHRVAMITRIERIGNQLWAEIWPEGIVNNEHCLTLDTADSKIEIGDDNVLVFTKARILGAHLSPIELWIWDGCPSNTDEKCRPDYQNGICFDCGAPAGMTSM